MLDYVNIIKDPYPDTRDPVTGEWLPKSAQMITHEQQKKMSAQSQKNMFNGLLSIFK